MGEPDGEKWATVIHSYTITESRATDSNDTTSLMTEKMLLDFYKDEAVVQQVIASKTKLGSGVGYQPNPDAPDCVEGR
eukprot:3680628-Alexandrium_andersonii.AAC.1